MERIYLDNAATTPIIDEVFETMLPFLKMHYGNPSSIHAEGRTARAALEKSRRNIAKAIGASPSEIFFTSGGTEANNTAIKCAVRDLGVKRIISSKIEHACVRNSVLATEAQDIEIVYVNVDQKGRADLNHLAELLADQSLKTLVSLMHSNNEVGTLNNITEIARLCEANNAYFHSDTVQTVGYFPIDLENHKIDFISGSGHKLYGPKGVGFLYINKEVHLSPLIDGGGQERQMRSGTENVASIVGLGKAVELAHNNMEEHRNHISALRQHFIQKLQENFADIVSFNGDLESDFHYKVLNVNFDTPIATDMLLFKLDLAGISASGGSACSSGAMKGSPVLAALGVEEHLRSVRFSFSHLNNIEEIDLCIHKLKQILG